MRILIPVGAAAAILWLRGRPEYAHLGHSKQLGAVLLVVGVFAVLEVLAVARSRRAKAKPSRPGLPYARSK